MTDFSQDQIDTLHYNALIFSSLSLFGSICIMIMFYRCHHRGVHQKIILYMTISDFIGATGFIFSRTFLGKSPGCEIQACLIQISLSGCFWNTIVGINYYRQTVLVLTDEEIQFKYYHIIAWSFPICSAIIGLYFKSQKFIYC